MRKRAIERALEALVEEAQHINTRSETTTWGTELCLANPAEVIQKRRKIGYQSCLHALRELERLGAIRLMRGVQNSIDSARIIKTSLEPAYHEEEEYDRLIATLNKHKRSSRIDTSSWIVHAYDFDLVRRDADIDACRFYANLQIMEEQGLIARHYARRGNRMIKIALNECFPLSAAN